MSFFFSDRSGNRVSSWVKPRSVSRDQTNGTCIVAHVSSQNKIYDVTRVPWNVTQRSETSQRPIGKAITHTVSRLTMLWTSLACFWERFYRHILQFLAWNVCMICCSFKDPIYFAKERLHEGNLLLWSAVLRTLDFETLALLCKKCAKWNSLSLQGW